MCLQAIALTYELREIREAHRLPVWATDAVVIMEVEHDETQIHSYCCHASHAYSRRC